MGPLSFKTGGNMPGVRSIAMTSVRTTVLCSPFRNFFIIHPSKKMLGLNDVEFNFRIGYFLVSFPILRIVNEKCKVTHGPPRN